MRTRLAAITLALAAALPATAAAQDAAPATYAALGDSFASGEGAAPDTYLPGTSFPDPATGGRSSTGCHRSTTSWAFRAQTRLGAPALTFVACSGATVADLTAPDDRFAALGAAEPPQVDAVTPSTTVATLSIGGNDAGYDRVLRACAYRPEDPANARCGRPGTATRRIAEAGLRGLDAALADAYVTVASRMAPGGRLLVVGYPRLFAGGGRGYRPDASIGGAPACRLGVTPLRTPVRVTLTGARFLNSVAADLNDAVRAGVADAAARLRATGATQTVAFVASDPAFRGHRLCNAVPWINGVRLTALGAPKRTSLHPGPKGQAAYARAVGAALAATPTSCHTPGRDGRMAMAVPTASNDRHAAAAKPAPASAQSMPPVSPATIVRVGVTFNSTRSGSGTPDDGSTGPPARGYAPAAAGARAATVRQRAVRRRVRDMGSSSVRGDRSGRASTAPLNRG